MKRLLVLLFPALVLAPAPLLGQTADMAAERARIANQRIQAEAERVAREEEERERLAAEQARAAETIALRQAPAQADSTVRPADAPPVTRNTDAVTPAPSSEADLSRTLEQIRTLGELKDAGYVTDDEFKRIKSKILSDVTP